MAMRMMLSSGATALAAMVAIGTAAAQDVPGIENCSAEKTMERRTGCLQSNVNFLKSALTRAELEAQRKLDAAARRIVATERDIAMLRAEIAALRASVAQLDAAAKEAAKTKEAPVK